MTSPDHDKHGLHCLAVPTPFPELKSVNLYFLRAGGGFYLVDGGMKGDDNRIQLKNKLDRLDLQLKDCKGVLHTHGHVDHFGLSAWVHEQSGAPLYIHRREDSQVEDRPWQDFSDAYTWRTTLLQRCAMPQIMLSLVNQGGKMFWSFNDRLPSQGLRWLTEGDSFVTDSGIWSVMETPGHSPGSVCFFQKEKRWLLSGDTVLESISPNPLIEPSNEEGDSSLSLLTYQQSLRKLEGRNPQWIFPGHDKPFTNFGALHQSLLGFSKKRQDTLYQQLSGHTYTVADLAEIHFPKRSVQEQYLIYSEVLGNLEVMVQQGRVVQESDEKGIWRFRVTA